MKAAEKLGIKVYTIGVGSTGRAPFLATDMLGRRRIIDSWVELDEPLLRKIARTTGGRYFNVKNRKGIEEAMEEIDKLEKTEIERNIYNQYNELFPWFLGPALGLIVLGTGLNMLVTRRIV
jgi:Ca-activated chloride channel family protein